MSDNITLKHSSKVGEKIVKDVDTTSPHTKIFPGQGGLIENPAKHDVLCGRGGRVNAHEGNLLFRTHVAAFKFEYVLLTKKIEKSNMQCEIVKLIRKLDPPGRFLKIDQASMLWIEIGDDSARKKAGQALREDAPELRDGLYKEEKINERKEKKAQMRIEAKIANDVRIAKNKSKRKKDNVKKRACLTKHGKTISNDAKAAREAEKKTARRYFLSSQLKSYSNTSSW